MTAEDRLEEHGPTPAWGDPFHIDRLEALCELRAVVPPTDEEWLDARGAGVTVAIVDSGVEGSHPAVGGRLIRSVTVELDGDNAEIVDDDPIDVVGHGTACAGIVHSLVPDAEIVSVRVLGKNNKAKGMAFAYGVDWVVDQGIAVANLSLSSRSDELYSTFHELADRAYFANSLLICAASNYAGQPSYPSLYSSVLGVAAHDLHDPLIWFYNPHPPVEFGAWGVDVPVAWRGGSTIMATGNSFAAPHIAGLAAKIRSLHPQATPFEVKALLAGSAASSISGAGSRGFPVPRYRSTGRSSRSPHSAHEPS
jgi:subtilisin